MIVTITHKAYLDSAGDFVGPETLTAIDSDNQSVALTLVCVGMSYQYAIDSMLRGDADVQSGAVNEAVEAWRQVGVMLGIIPDN